MAPSSPTSVPGPEPLGERAEARGQGVVDLVGLARHVEQVHAGDEGVGRRGVVEHDRALAGEVLGAHERDVPRVAVPAGQLQTDLLARRADPDVRAGLHRLGVAAGVGEREELALEVGHVLGEQQPDALDRLGHAPQSHRRRLERDAVGLVLPHVPAGAQAQLEPAVAEVVDGGRRVGQHRRMAVAGGVDERADPRPGGERGQRGVARDALEAVAVERRRRRVEVVPDADPVEAELARRWTTPASARTWCTSAVRRGRRSAPRWPWPQWWTWADRRRARQLLSALGASPTSLSP